MNGNFVPDKGHMPGGVWNLVRMRGDEHSTRPVLLVPREEGD